LTICSSYVWEMALNVGLAVSFDNMYDWNGIWEEAGKVKLMRITNDGSSSLMHAECYTSLSITVEGFGHVYRHWRRALVTIK
jgi:hypothetical protein